jgi:two-component system, chemotaxis family, response regulator PixG
MNTLSITGRSFQRIHPLSLLAQLISRYTRGCLQISDGSTTWHLYLDQGKLAFATSSEAPFDRLDRQLRSLQRQVPTLVSAVRVQMRLMFETRSAQPGQVSIDYQAIGWLVDQQYLSANQAKLLIEELAKEVLGSFLALTEGYYEVLERERFGTDYPGLCQLDLRPLVEQCQHPQNQPAHRPQAAPTGLQGATYVNMPPHRTAPASKSTWESRPVTPFNVRQISEAGGRWAATDGRSAVARRTIDPPPSAPAAPVAARYTIACIDDSQTILQSIRAFLDDSSFSVIMINDPVKALMQVVRNRPDLILLDVGMPNLDGYELCSLLRRHPHFRHTPIIMVTGLTGFIDRAKAKLVGASGYLAKPFNQSELLKTVFKHLT